MSAIDRKACIREYKETSRPAGVYQVRNVMRGKSLVGSSRDLSGILNRQRFQLKNGSHPDRELQQDWNELGPDAFEFTVVDTLSPTQKPDYDPTADLAVLLEMWREKLAESGEAMYGQTRRSR